MRDRIGEFALAYTTGEPQAHIGEFMARKAPNRGLSYGVALRRFNRLPAAVEDAGLNVGSCRELTLDLAEPGWPWQAESSPWSTGNQARKWLLAARTIAHYLPDDP